MFRLLIILLISGLCLACTESGAAPRETNDSIHANHKMNSDVNNRTDHAGHDMNEMVDERKQKDSSALSQLVDVQLQSSFSLQMADGTDEGKTVTEADFEGQYLLISFGFTHCAHVCPTLLSDLARMITLLPEEKRQRLTLLFVSLDSERDTPAITDAYARNFNSKFIGLSGSAAQVNAVAKNLRITYLKIPVDDGYRIDHTSISYLVTPERQVAGLFGFGSASPQVAEQIATIIE